MERDEHITFGPGEFNKSFQPLLIGPLRRAEPYTIKIYDAVTDRDIISYTNNQSANVTSVKSCDGSISVNLTDLTVTNHLLPTAVREVNLTVQFSQFGTGLQYHPRSSVYIQISE